MVPARGGGVRDSAADKARHHPHPLINPLIIHVNNGHAALISVSKGRKGHRLSPISWHLIRPFRNQRCVIKRRVGFAWASRSWSGLLHLPQWGVNWLIYELNVSRIPGEYQDKLLLASRADPPRPLAASHPPPPHHFNTIARSHKNNNLVLEVIYGVPSNLNGWPLNMRFNTNVEL